MSTFYNGYLRLQGIMKDDYGIKIITTPKHIANCFTKQFTNTVKHATHKINRYPNRATNKIQGYNITFTTTQVQEEIKQIKNNNSQGPDKLNIRHLKYICPLGLAFLTSMLKTALNTNIIPHIWKLANIGPIPKPNKDIDKSTSYRPISLLSVIAKTLEKSLVPYITANIPNSVGGVDGVGGVGGVGGEWVGGLDQGRERWGGVMSVGGVSLNYLCR